MTIIDPDQHSDLIALQRASTAAHEKVLAYDPAPGGEESEEQRAERRRLRAAAAEAAGAKEKALHASGLVREHGYHQVNVDLRNAARD